MAMVSKNCMKCDRLQGVVALVVVVVGSQLLATVSFHGTVGEVFMPDMYASLGKEKNSETTF